MVARINADILLSNYELYIMRMVKGIDMQSLIEYEKMQAAVKLLAELGKGVESIRNEGTLSVDETFAELEDI